MQTQAESFYQQPGSKLLGNYSTGQLIPSCRRQLFKAKREHLLRSINRAANQLYNLKYDNEIELLELRRLTEMGEQLYEKAVEHKHKVEDNIIHTIKPLQLELTNIEEEEEKRKINTDRSTEHNSETDPHPASENNQNINSRPASQISAKDSLNMMTKSLVLQRTSPKQNLTCSPKKKEKSCSAKIIHIQQPVKTNNIQFFLNIFLLLIGVIIIFLLL